MKEASSLDEFPLSLGQKALWFLHKFSSDHSAYNINMAWQVEGGMDEEVFATCLEYLTKRHVSLRTRYESSVEGELHQSLDVSKKVNIQTIDASTWSPLSLKEDLAKQSHQAFNLKTDALWRWVVYQQGEKQQTVLCSLHHIAVDLCSLMILLGELSKLYSTFKSMVDDGASITACLDCADTLLAPVDSCSYQRFVKRQRKLIASSKGEQLQQYWDRQLRDTLDPLNLPTDFPRPPVLSYQGRRLSTRLSSDVADKVAALAQKGGVNLFAFYLGVYQLLLYRYSGQKTILTATPTAGRRTKEQMAVGYFVNPIVLKGDFSGGPSFREYLQQIQSTVIAGVLHQDYPFIKIVEDLQPKRDTSRAPITTVSFAWNEPEAFGKGIGPKISMNADGSEVWDVAGMGWQRIDLRAQVDEYDLFFTASNLGQDMALCLEYNSDLFSASTIERMLGHYQQLLAGIVDNPDLPVEQFSLLSGAEKQELHRWNEVSSVEQGHAQCVHQWFEAQVLRQPDAIAVIDGLEEYSYRALNQQANQLAHYLQTHGVETNTLVGLCMDRSFMMLVAMYGILKAGGAYVPLDPKYPPDRLGFILEDAKIETVLSLSSLKDVLPDHIPTLVCLDTDGEVIAKHRTDNPPAGPVNNVRQLGYVIFTSGSTGRPKGVGVEHGGVSALIDFAREHFSSEELAGVLASTSLNFDIHVFETLVPLALGGCAIVAENALYLSALAARDKVKLINTVPSAIKALLQIDAIPSSVMTVNLAGEPLTNVVVQSIYRLDGIERVFNLYGPSEDTVYSTYYLTEKGADYEPYIGRPVTATQAYVLDEQMQHVPVGLAGELFLGGAGLAREYINRPDMTNERFVPNPFDSEGESRLYRTGDLVKFRADGMIELLGRVDFQVKIRGFRIELGEIEANLYRHVAVQEAIVMAQEDAIGDKVLIAYVVAKTADTKKDAETAEPPVQELEHELRDFLKTKLPEYMVPVQFMLLDSMPLNPNGKIDRKALPQPRFAEADRRFQKRAARRSSVATMIATAWSQVLGIKDIPIHANFFDLGGHSLLMVQVYANLRKSLPEAVELIDLYQYPTIHGLETFMRQQQSASAEPAALKDQRNKVRTKRAKQTTGRIAIVGMSCRFPEAETTEQFWNNIKQGVESIGEFTREEIEQSGVESSLAQQPNYVMRSGALANVEEFDADFFSFTPREAQITDPQQRIFLECAWEALEDAGVVPGADSSRLIGIYAGSGQNSYYLNHLANNLQLQKTVGSYPLLLANDKDFLCSRVAYKLNTKGPSLCVQSACSTALYATHTACSSLLQGDCDIALAGGVSLSGLQKGYLYQEGMILSPDGHCRSFDAKAHGTVPSQGSGIVVLKRLEDALEDRNHIYALIIGSAVNNDGADKVGYSAPAVSGQANVIQSAHAAAGIKADTISYVETHGTATPFGDPVELKGLTQAFNHGAGNNPPPVGSCALGSVKSNIGHADSAAGVAGLIKTAKALQNQMLPPSLHYEQANNQIRFEETPFYVNTTLEPWLVESPRVRRAGVSSFGMGGTNAHVVMEEYRTPDRILAPVHAWHLIPVSAKTPTALDRMLHNLSCHISSSRSIELQDIAYTLQNGRRDHAYRQFFVTHSLDDLQRQLQCSTDYAAQSGFVKESVDSHFAFMFSGQGSQYAGMGKVLYENLDYYRQQVDECLRVLNKDHPALYAIYQKDELLGLTETVNETFVTQPALFILEYSLAKLLIHWGLEPSYMIGHSLGEYVAACLADVMSLSDALFLLINRAELTRRIPTGSMLSVKLSEAEVKPLLKTGLDLAVINSSQRCSVAGPHEKVKDLLEYCEQHSIEARLLPVSHAFHSAMLDPILEEFHAIAAHITLSPPKLPMISNVTGTWLTAEQATNPEYWVTHLRNTNRFADGMKNLLEKDSHLTFLEVGPGRVLATLARQHDQRTPSHLVYSTLPHAQDDEKDPDILLKAMGTLWSKGCAMDWSHLPNEGRPQLIPLPSYPFERKRYWIDPQKAKASAGDSDGLLSDAAVQTLSSGGGTAVSLSGSLSVTESRLLVIWQEFLGIEEIAISDNFFDLGGDSLMAVRMVNHLRESFSVVLDNHILMKQPTIKQLAKALDALQEEVCTEAGESLPEKFELMVELQKGDGPTNWFLIHPGGGHLYFYNDFIRHLKSRRGVYGIQARGIDGSADPIDSIRAMAKLYAEEIQRVQPEGPYWLGGASFGGMVAFEIAQLLREKNHDVPLLFMIDTPGPGQMMARFKNNAEILQHFFEDLSLSNEILNDNEQDLDQQVAYVKDVAQQLRKTDLLPPHFGSHFIRMVTAHYQAMYDYQPCDYDSGLVFFRHSEVMAEYARHPEMAWLPIVHGGCHVFPVPGNHLTMNFDPNVQQLVKQLHRVIQDLGETP